MLRNSERKYLLTHIELTVKYIMDATGGRGADVVIEAVGEQSSLDVATKIAKIRGTLVIFGYYVGEPRIIDMERWNWNSKWVFWVADGRYVLGSFNGERFKQEAETRRLYWGDSYAAQTWNNIPPEDGRRIQMAWLKTKNGAPNMPFSQQMTFPCVLTLRKTGDGLRLFGEPVKEIQKLHNRRLVKENFYLSGKMDLTKGLSSDLLDIRGEFRIETGS
ncbi:MAG: zinc-binding dehydrogenase [Candidatus Bathyarchaeia archaeon]